MTDNRPRCKWCAERLELSDKGQPICTFCPLDKWGDIELSEAERLAVEEAEALSQLWIRDQRRQKRRLCPEPYFSTQSDKNYYLSEMAFERLLFSNQMVCGKCYSNYVHGPTEHSLGLN